MFFTCHHTNVVFTKWAKTQATGVHPTIHLQKSAQYTIMQLLQQSSNIRRLICIHELYPALHCVGVFITLKMNTV